MNASSHVNLGLLHDFVIPSALLGHVLIVRLTLFASRSNNSSSSAGDESNMPLATNDYHFGIVETSAPEAQKSHKAGVLRPLLLAPAVALQVAATVGHQNATAFSVWSAGNAPALFVKPMLLNAAGMQLPYVVFSTAFVTIRPGDRGTFTVVQMDGRAAQFCAEAWNAARVCVKLAGGFLARQ